MAELIVTEPTAVIIEETQSFGNENPINGDDQTESKIEPFIEPVDANREVLELAPAQKPSKPKPMKRKRSETTNFPVLRSSVKKQRTRSKPTPAPPLTTVKNKSIIKVVSVKAKKTSQKTTAVKISLKKPTKVVSVKTKAKKVAKKKTSQNTTPVKISLIKPVKAKGKTVVAKRANK